MITEPTITHRRVTITPEWAAHILQRNTRNRNFSPNGLAYRKIEQALIRGEWAYNGEPIQLAHDGTLLNGQHRLEACKRTGIPIETLLVEGLPVEAQDTIDLGRARNLGDALAISGETQTRNLAAVVAADIIRNDSGLEASLSMSGRSKGAAAISPTRALDHLEGNPHLRDQMRDARALYDNGGRSLKLTVRTLFLLKTTTDAIDPDDSLDFWEKVTVGVGLSRQDPILLLRNTLTRLASDPRVTPDQRHLAAFVIKTWNAYRDGAQPRVLKFTQGGAHPEAFPIAR